MASIFEITGPRGSGGPSYQRFDTEERDVWGRSALLSDALSNVNEGRNPRPHYKRGGWLSCLTFTRPMDWWDGLTLKQQKAYKIVFIAAGVFLAFILLVVVPAAMASKPPGTGPLVSLTPPPPLLGVSEDALCTWEGLELPTTVAPESYAVSLTLKESGMDSSVYGYVDITAQSAPSRCAVLHAGKGMTIKGVYYTHKDKQVHGKLHEYNESSQMATLVFDEPLPDTSGDVFGRPAVPVVMHVEFEYEVEEGVNGLYRSHYKDGMGVKHTIYATQLQSIYARKMVPCFDEPKWKAKWTLTVVTPPGPGGSRVVLSNMPHATPPSKIEGSNPGSLIRHSFVQTPPMSSYLLAVVIGDLNKVSITCNVPSSFYQGTEQVDISGWAAPDRVDKLGTALDVACSSMSTFTEAFKTPYSLPKLDLVAIPVVATEAMENWGLIIFHESMLLLDAGGASSGPGLPGAPSSDSDLLQTWRITQVVSHEISHQWAGNLVTMQGWKELWINEGMAAYFENLAADKFRPSYGFFDLFFVDSTSPALDMDSYTTTHALSSMTPILQMSEIENMFDTISYEKGAAIIRMLRAYMLYGSTATPSKMLGGNDAPMSLRRSLQQTAPPFHFPAPSRRSLKQFHFDFRPRPPPPPPQQEAIQPPPPEFHFTFQPTNSPPPPPPEFHFNFQPTNSPPPPQFTFQPPPPPEFHFNFQPTNSPPPPPQFTFQPPPPPEFHFNFQPTNHPPPPPPPQFTLQPPPPEFHFNFQPTNSPPPPPPQQLGFQPPPPPEFHFSFQPPVLPPPPHEFHFNFQPHPSLTTPPAPPSPLAFTFNPPAAQGTLPPPPPKFHFNFQPTKPPIIPQLTPPPAAPVPPPEDPLLKAMADFFQQYAFTSVNYTQLWGSIAKSTGMPVDKWMVSWTTEKNYPVLEPVVKAVDGVGPVLFVSQRSVLANSSESSCFDTSTSGRWWVPMAYKSLANTSAASLWHAFDSCSTQFPLLEDQGGVMIQSEGLNKCVVLNPGRLGFYRTLYTPECWTAHSALAPQPDKMSSIDLAGMLDDALFFSRTGDLKISTFLEFTRALPQRLQAEYAPWSMAISWLEDSLFKLELAAVSDSSKKPCADNVRAYIKTQTGFYLKNYKPSGHPFPGVGFEVGSAESAELRMLRPLLLLAAGRAGETTLTKGAWSKLKAIVPNPDALTRAELVPARGLSPDVRETVYALAALSGDPDAWHTVKQMYRASHDPVDQARLISALTYVPPGDVDALSQALEFLMSDEILVQDLATALIRLGSHSGDAFHAVWIVFLGSRMEEIIDRYPSPQDATYSLGPTLMEFGRYFVDYGQLAQLQKFADKYTNILNPDFMDSVKEAIARNQHWLKYRAPELCSWMQSAQG